MVVSLKKYCFKHWRDKDHCTIILHYWSRNNTRNQANVIDAELRRNLQDLEQDIHRLQESGGGGERAGRCRSLQEIIDEIHRPPPKK